MIHIKKIIRKILSKVPGFMGLAAWLIIQIGFFLFLEKVFEHNQDMSQEDMQGMGQGAGLFWLLFALLTSIVGFLVHDFFYHKLNFKKYEE